MRSKKFLSAIAAAVSVAAISSFAAISAFADDATAAATDASAAQGSSTGGAFLSMILPLLIMFLLLYFIAIRPQKKRDRELKDMQDSIQVGDRVVTGGGIVGIVVRTGEDTVVIETGGERFKIRVKTWAITENVTAAERLKEAKANAASKKSESAGLSAAALTDETEKDKEKKKKDSSEE